MEKNKDIFDKIMSLPGLRALYPFYSRHKEPLLYLFFGALTTLLNLFVFWLCAKAMPPLWANIIAWIAGVIFAYVTNRIWVFNSKSENLIKEFLSFTAGRLATLGLEELVLWVGISLLGLNTMAVKITAQILVIIGNYLVSKLFVFKKQ